MYVSRVATTSVILLIMVYVVMTEEIRIGWFLGHLDYRIEGTEILDHPIYRLAEIEEQYRTTTPNKLSPMVQLMLTLAVFCWRRNDLRSIIPTFTILIVQQDWSQEQLSLPLTTCLCRQF